MDGDGEREKVARGTKGNNMGKRFSVLKDFTVALMCSSH